uniref:Platelet endothelial cell adhesion molecule n=1 Tax=Sphenodon punctatus TaxID=8508 RepID=A0A8D0GCE7_SPHPU
MYFVLLMILLCCASLKAQQNVFTINHVTLQADPSVEVHNGASVNLICRVDISKEDGIFQLKHMFNFFKNGNIMTNVTSEQEWVSFKISPAAYSDSGTYKCSVTVNDKHLASAALTIEVKGVTKPRLTALKKEVVEGDSVPLHCYVPEEEPPFLFTFYKIVSSQPPAQDTKYEREKKFAEFEFPVAVGDSILHFECTVRVQSTMGTSAVSERSERVLVTVVDIFSKPKWTFHSPLNVTEGDRIHLECTTITADHHPNQFEIIIQKDKRILNSTKDVGSVSYSTVATMKDNGNYTCKVERGTVSKANAVSVVVAELFSKPILTPSSKHMNEDSNLTLTCHVNGLPHMNFSIMKETHRDIILLKSSRIYTVIARVTDSGNYSCKAQLKGLAKRSDPIMITVYAPVSVPVLSVNSSLSEVVLGKTFLLRCHSMFGTPPINYTLFRGNRFVNFSRVHTNLSAEFWETATEDLGEYRCQARNGHSHIKRESNRLNVTVIAPVDNINIGSSPYGEVEDGKEISFMCSIHSGSLPVEFRLYKESQAKPFYQYNGMNTHTVWFKPAFSKQDAGKYFCTASNRANITIKSRFLTVKVVLASWQKGLIVATALVVVLVTALAFLWWNLRKKTRAQARAMELSRSTPTINSATVKLTSEQNNDGEFYYGTGYNEDGENHVKMTDENKDSGENRHSRIEGAPDAT